MIRSSTPTLSSVNVLYDRFCKFYGFHPTTRARSYKSGIQLPRDIYKRSSKCNSMISPMRGPFFPQNKTNPITAIPSNVSAALRNGKHAPPPSNETVEVVPDFSQVYNVRSPLSPPKTTASEITWNARPSSYGWHTPGIRNTF